jgi:Holliday junction resolvase RusA-like endonuclease
VTDARAFAQIAAAAVEPPKPAAPAKASNAVVLRVGPAFSTNAMYRSFSRGKGLATIKSKAYRDWQSRTLGVIATQKWQPITGCFGLQIKLPKATRIDLDNTAKAFLDTLRHAGVIVDDSPKYLRRLEIIVGWSKDTTLTLKPLETPDDSE